MRRSFCTLGGTVWLNLRWPDERLAEFTTLLAAAALAFVGAAADATGSESAVTTMDTADSALREAAIYTEICYPPKKTPQHH